jgi:signal transduction histidine kinase
VAQEALRNISKHARARHVSVTIASAGCLVSLSIADKGVGFPVWAANSGFGLGIANMRERVRWVKGTFSLESKPGCGARISVEVPIPGATP